MSSRWLKPFARRLRMYREQQGLCWLCGEHLDLFLPPCSYGGATFEHIVARNHGGSDAWCNMRLTHFECNQARGDRLTWQLARPRSVSEAMAGTRKKQRRFSKALHVLRPLFRRAADHIEGLS